MPLSDHDTPRRLGRAPCTECMFSVGATVTIAGTTHGWCLNHLVQMVHPLLAAAQRAPESLPVGHCVACGADTRVVHVDYGHWNGALCPGHALAYLSHSLSPPAFRRILAEAGAEQNEIFALHDDFYTEDGNALQPSAVPIPSLDARVRELQTLPGLGEDAGCEWHPALLTELLGLAREDYLLWTGLQEEATEFLACILVHEAVMTESFRREGLFTDDRPQAGEQVEAVRAALEPLLAESIPAAADRLTCRRLSGWMSARLTTRQSPVDIAKILTLGLSVGRPTVGAGLPDERECEPFVTAAAARIFREVLPMIGHTE